MARITRRKAPVKRTTSRKKKSLFPLNKVIFVLVFISFLFAAFYYKNTILYYLSYKSNKVIESDKLAEARIFEILNKNENKVVGIDISEYQGKINWEKVDSVDSEKIGFVFVRSTVGNDRVDYKFKTNWEKANDKKLICGAYHYYRPNENSKLQANNFIKNVHLKKGDLPPVLDIEKLPKTQSIDSLKIGIKRWLTIVENHYNVKPIIYTGEKYYDSFLKDDFKGYTFWIANYNPWVETIKEDWLFWQFTEKAVINGINEKVDVNIYNGTPKMLEYLTISN